MIHLVKVFLDSKGESFLIHVASKKKRSLNILEAVPIQSCDAL